MSEPIRTAEELVEACKDLTLSSVLALKYCPRSGLSGEVSLALSLVPENAHHANRILDYLGLDYCKDGETPRERIDRERKDTDTLLGLLTAERRRAEDAERRIGELESTLRANEAATGATRELIVAWDTARDELAAVRGALIDAGNVPVGDETSLADGVRQLTAERDHLKSQLLIGNPVFAAGLATTLKDECERQHALANAAEAERDRYRDALVRVARLWRATLPHPKGEPDTGLSYYIGKVARTSDKLHRILIAAGLDPDTLGVE